MTSLHDTCPMVNKHSNHDYQVVINAPLEVVWDVLAVRFENVSDWSSGVPGSRVADVSGADGAPVPGRVCESSWRGFDSITETIVEYGEDPYFFKYIASGTPAWMGVASNIWHVERIDETKTLVYFEPCIEPTGRIGRIVVPVFIRFARKLATDTLDDLEVFVEPANLRDASRRSPPSGLSRSWVRLADHAGEGVTLEVGLAHDLHQRVIE